MQYWCLKFSYFLMSWIQESRYYIHYWHPLFRTWSQIMHLNQNLSHWQTRRCADGVHKFGTISTHINLGSFQPELQKSPSTKHGMQNRRFRFSWFSKFPWLEYSISKDKTFCFPCFLFYDTSTKYNAFIVDGCQNWKYVSCDKKFILHYMKGVMVFLQSRHGKVEQFKGSI